MNLNKVSELSQLIEDFLLENSNVSINALAMRMGIAETTLRRVRAGKSKRLPNSENLLKIIFYIYKSKDLYEVKEQLPKALKEHFTNVYLLFDSGRSNPVVELDDSVVDNQITYLVLKLASNHSGVKKSEVLRLFGELGLRSTEKLIKSEVIVEESGIFRTIVNAFRLSDNSFINNFKSVADFIKIDPDKRVGPNIYHNLSESLNLDGLVRIQTIQKKAVSEMTAILNDEKFKGDLPVFSLVAVDTIH